MGMRSGTTRMMFSYDANGNVLSVDYSSNSGSTYTTYYYLRNAQNDVVGLIDGSGNKVVEYTYTTWGKVYSTTGTLASTLGTKQPFRYRGYVYDTETGWYYLQSRYYDPAACRFISPDVYLSTGQGVLGHNSFAYCMNNPVNMSDDTGSFSFSNIFSGAGLLTIGFTAVAAALTILTCGAAAPVMVGVAAVTATAGAVTVVNGAAEIGEGVTATNETSNDGYNFMRDGVLGGNAYAYDLQKNTFAAIAEVGTAVCTSYVSYKGSVCFVAGTMVLTEGGNIPIEDIEAGDYVYATNPEIGESGCKRVVQTFERETNELVKVTYKGETITTTPTHPFYVPQKGWTEAIELRAGDILVTCNGEYVVVEKVQHEILESPVTVYNFEVEDYHTYYVAASTNAGHDYAFVLVHNTCGDMARGRKIHKDWDYGQNGKSFRTEVSIPGAGRADAVDFANRIVYELKPNNARAIKAGWKQLNRYANALEAIDGGTWIKILITY